MNSTELVDGRRDQSAELHKGRRSDCSGLVCMISRQPTNVDHGWAARCTSVHIGRQIVEVQGLLVGLRYRCSAVGARGSAANWTTVCGDATASCWTVTPHEASARCVGFSEHKSKAARRRHHDVDDTTCCQSRTEAKPVSCSASKAVFGRRAT